MIFRKHFAPFFGPNVQSAQSVAALFFKIGVLMDIDKRKRRGRLCLSGALAPERAAELASSALRAAGAEDLETLVIDLQQVSLTRRMSVVECHHVGECLARAGRGLLKVAFITSDECAQHHGFLFTVAANRGLCVATFKEEGDALGWIGHAA